MKKTFTALLLTCMAFGAYSQKAFVSGFGGFNSVSTATKLQTNNICCGNMVYAANSYDSNLVYIAHWNNNVIYYMDPINETLVDSMNLRVWDIISDDSINTLFAAQTVNNAVYIIDPVAKTYDSITVTEPNMLEKRPGKKEIWVTNKYQYSVINYDNAPTITSYTFTSANTFYRDEVRFNDDGSVALLTHGFENKVYKIDANTKAILDSLTVLGAYGVEFSYDNTQFYLSTGLQNKIYTCDIATMTIVDSVLTTRNPSTMYRSPYSQELWVVDHNQDTISVYDPTTMQINDSIDLASGSPYYIVFHSGTLSVSDTKAQSDIINIYPNPVISTVYLGSTYETVTVIDVMGKLVQTCEQCDRMDASDWIPGNYFIRTIKDGRTNVQRVIKQ